MTGIASTHLDPATLLSFAAGTLAEPLAAVAASHIAMCTECLAGLRDMELVGSALLGSAALAPAGTGDIAVPLRPAGEAADRAMLSSPARPAAADKLPPPIAARYGLSFDTIPWRRLAPGIWHHRLALSPGAVGDLRLLKIAAGMRMPEHGHGGAELTLVLDGAYSDETGVYRPGDMQDVDEETEHLPIADRDLGCICLIASERPARFKGIVGRLMQPLTGL